MVSQLITGLTAFVMLASALPAWLSATVAAKPARAIAALATISVINDEHEPVNVLLLRDQAQYDLGMVARGGTEVFQIPSDLVGASDVRIVADPRDDIKGFNSKPLTLEAGQ